MTRVFAVAAARRQPSDRFAACRVVPSCYRIGMVDMHTKSAADRIDRALARIEAALADRSLHDDSLAKRHAALRQTMTEAVRVLDDVLTDRAD